MRIIRWMYGYARLDRIRTKVIRNTVKVTPIDDKMREDKLR